MDQPSPLPAKGPTAAAVIATTWTLLCVAALLIAARLHLRLRIKRQRLAVSDGLICLAWCSAATYASFDIVFLKLGLLDPAVHEAMTSFQADPAKLQTISMYLWASFAPFYTTFYLWKAAILSFYLQIFPATLSAKRNLLLVVIGYSAVAYIVSMSFYFFLCFPVQRNWALDDTACPLWGSSVIFRVLYAMHFSTDIFIFLLPFILLRGHRMRRATKIGVFLTFLLGAISIALCLARILVMELPFIYGNGRPPPFTLIELWNALEYGIGLIVAILPSLRPYLRMARQGSSPPGGQPGRDAVSDFHLRRMNKGFSSFTGRKTTNTSTESQPATMDAVVGKGWNDEDGILNSVPSRSDKQGTEGRCVMELAEGATSGRMGVSVV